MGLEHVGFVVDSELEAFVRAHQAALTGRQYQGDFADPAYTLFAEDYSHVKFYRQSLAEMCEREGRSLDGFEHVDWSPADDLAGPYERT